MIQLQSWLNLAVAWIYAHLAFAQGNPWAIAATVALAGWVAFRLAAKVLGWVGQAAVIAATVMIVARVVGVGL